MHGTSQAEILRIRRENLAAERVEKARKEKAKSAEKERVYDQLQAIGGLMKTQDAVEGLERLKTGKRGDQKVLLDAVKTQISFRKKNLSQEIPAKLGSFSQDKKAYSLEEMT